MKYSPYMLEPSGVAGLASPDYLDFIDRTVFEAGLKLLYERHRLRPDFPYPDTKFNPNTGADLPPESYDELYPWFFGRGAEACAAHLCIIDRIDGLNDIRREIRSMLEGFVFSLTDAVLLTVKTNNGRCPFRVDRGFRAIKAGGAPAEVDTSGRGAGDLFCAKGLLASASSPKIEVGKRMFDEYVKAVFDQRVLSEQSPGNRALVGQGACMLALGAIPLLLKASSGAELASYADTAAALLNFVLERHFDEAGGRFSEYVSRDTAERGEYIDPGHATELVGLGIQAVAAVKSACPDASAEIQRACT
ncbi:MAG TPA: hypothetical protein ENN09_01780, partial [Planctomycetes bacterium]|nr:hypothetical protein [Planctomycetota bacterium]